MKKCILSFVAIAGILLILNQSLSAQEEQSASKVFYTELGGGGIIMSMNFDQRFTPDSKVGFGYRIGVGFGIGEFEGNYTNQWGWMEYETKTYYSIPVGLNYVFGNPRSAASFEVGGGATFLTRKIPYTLGLYYDGEPGNVIGYLTFMFRAVPANGGFSFRGGFTPIINPGGNLVPMGAISFGYAF